MNWSVTRQIVVVAVSIACLFGLLLATGCGDPDERRVGGECSAHSDCEERCVRGSDFPDGMCTLSCDDYRDCPGGTSCISKKDGVCAMECERDRDCPGGYECESTSRRGESGSQRVCLG